MKTSGSQRPLINREAKAQESLMHLARRLSSCAVVLLLLLAGSVTMAATPQGLSMGSNVAGQTGLDTDTGNTFLPAFLDTTNLGTSEVIGVSAGWYHSLLVTVDGKAYSFGYGGDFTLGFGNDADNVLVPTEITITLSDVTVTQASAGSRHSLFLDSDGIVYSVGRNSNGATGRNTTSGSTVNPTAINADNLTGVSVTQIAAGERFSLILGDNGVVYSFGGGAAGRTGQNGTGDTLVATAINDTNLTDKTIVHISAGEVHSLLVDSDGVAYSMGRNSFGRTGQGTQAGDLLIATPIDDTNLSGVTITRGAAGREHSLLLADNGDVYAFGRNDSGRTGFNTSAGIVDIATLIDMTNINAAGDTIIDIAAGETYSLLLAASGTVYGFGSNSMGQLGFDDDITEVLRATAIDTSMLPPGFVFTHIAASITGGYTVSALGADRQHSLLAGYIPEPGSAMLLLAGASVMMLRPRRREQQA